MAERTRRRGRRVLKTFVILLIVLVALVAIVAVTIPLVLTDARVRSIVISQAEKSLNAKVKIDSLHYSFGGDLQITGLVIETPEGFSRERQLLAVEQADAHVNVWPLVWSLGKKIHLTASVTNPRLVVERNAQGQVNLTQLVKPTEKKEKPPTKPTALKELSASIRVTGGNVTFFIAGAEQPVSEIQDIVLEADIPAIDQPLTYKLTAGSGEGTLRVEGAPYLFNNGVVAPAALRGEILHATVSKFPTSGMLAAFGAPPLIDTVDGQLDVTADSGNLAAKGEFTGAGAAQQLDITASLDSQIDLQNLNAAADLAIDARPFSRAEAKINIENAGSKTLKIEAAFNVDLAKLPKETAAMLGLPLSPQGGPVVERGQVFGSLIVTGPLPVINVKTAFSVTGLEVTPSVTGGIKLPPEDATLTAEAKVVMTGGGLSEINIPLIDAQASFINAQISKVRVWSLDKIEQLGIDASGTVKFDGPEFSQRFGKALGLPPLHDRIEFAFVGKGASGNTEISANGRIERVSEPALPMKFDFAAVLAGANDRLDAKNINFVLRADDGAAGEASYAKMIVSGNVNDITRNPVAIITFDLNADLGRLAARFANYSAALAEIAPQGVVSVTGGKFTGGPNEFSTSFKLVAENMGLASLPAEMKIPTEAVNALQQKRVDCEVAVTIAPPQRKVTIDAFKLQTPMLAADVRGTIADYTAMSADVQFDFSADTAPAGVILRAMEIMPDSVDTAGRFAAAGRANTIGKAIELRKLEVDNAYLKLGLREKLVITGVDVPALKADPAGALKAIDATGLLAGEVMLDAVAKLPRELLPPNVVMSGVVPFSLRLSQGRTVAVNVAATAAMIKVGDKFEKPASGPASFSAVASFPADGSIVVSSFDALLEGAELHAAGNIAADKTVASFRLNGQLTELEKIAAFMPMVNNPSGGVEFALEGDAPLTGDIATARMTGHVNFSKLSGTYAAAPDLSATLDGRITVNMAKVDAGGLVITIVNVPLKETTVVTLDEFSLTPISGENVTASFDALNLNVAVSSPSINLNSIMSALPQSPAAEPQASATGPLIPPELADKLRGHRASGRFAFGKIIYQRHQAANVSGAFELRENKFTMTKPLHADIYDGAVDVDVQADINDPALAHSGKFAAQGVDINQVAAAAMNQPDVFQGQVNLNATWAGKGFDKQQIETSWSGDGASAIADGVVMNFNKMPLLAGIAGPVLEFFGAAALPDNQFKYKPIKLDLQLRDGRVSTKDFMLEGQNGLDVSIPQGSVGLDGTLNLTLSILPPKELVLKYVSERFSNPTAVAIIEQAIAEKRPVFTTFNITGPAKRPSIRADLAAFPKWVTSVVAESLRRPDVILDSILKEQQRRQEEKRQKESGERAPAEPPTEQKQEQKPEDAIRGLFEDLIKKK